MTTQITHVPSPVGSLTLAAREGRLIGLWLEGQRHYMDGAYGSLQESPDAAPFPRIAQWLKDYFSGGRPDASSLPLAPEGTAFQRRVWRELLLIPYGKTVTYGQLAQRLGSSPRAVGSAVGRNPISILIPCHRVLGAGGALTGYAGGLDNKRLLLALESAAGRMP